MHLSNLRGNSITWCLPCFPTQINHPGRQGWVTATSHLLHFTVLCVVCLWLFVCINMLSSERQELSICGLLPVLCENRAFYQR